MWINYLFSFVYIFGSSQLLAAATKDWIKDVIKQAKGNLNIYQAFTFITDDCDPPTKDCDKLLAEISQNIPIMVINRKKMKESGDNRWMNSLELKNPRMSGLFLILSRNNHTQVQDNLNFISNISSINPRPKCLAIFLQGTSSSNLELEKTLKHAWQLKYLDFSIIIKRFDDEFDFAFYNPFSNQYSIQKFDSNSVIFPDKMKNMFQWKLNVPLIHIPPYMFVHESLEKALAKRSYGYFDSFFDPISEKLNFSMNYTPINFTSHDDISKKIRTNLKNNTLSVSVLPLNFIFRRYNILFGMSLSYSKLVIIVPHRVKETSHLLGDFSTIIYFFILLIIFRFVVQLFRFPVQNWNLFNMYRFFMENNPLINPVNTVQKIIYLSMIVLSLKLSTELFTSSQLNILKGGEEIKSFKDVLKSNFSISSSTTEFAEIFIEKQKEYGDYNIRDVKLLNIQGGIASCIENVINFQNSICLVSNTAANYYLVPYRSKASGQKLKILDPDFYGSFISFTYEDASPYLRKIDRITQLVIESGITEFNRTAEKGKNTIKLEDAFLSTRLVIVLASGYFLSFCIFFLEILINKLEKCLNIILYLTSV